MSELDVIRRSAEVLAAQGRSFAWAAPFLPPKARADAAICYAFCRLVDDAADEAASPEEGRTALLALEAELEGRAPARPFVAAYREVAARNGIDPRVARDLVEGARSDLGRVRVKDDEELLLYAYRVAGTVGLMMARLIGAHDPRALRHAVDLGVAMQITNICRDVAEDAGRDRVYLPKERLVAVGVAPEALLEGRAQPRAVTRVVADLVALADRFYASADEGMRYIPPRARLAIWIAARVYRAIGLKVVKRGEQALRSRTTLGTGERLRWSLAALFAFGGLGRLRARLPASKVRGRELLPA